MAQEDWGDLETLNKSKGGRNWLAWGCGLGCLGVILLGVVLVLGAKSWFEDFFDAESARAGMAELVQLTPAAEDKGDWALRGGKKIPFVDVFVYPIEGVPEGAHPGLKAVLVVIDGDEEVAQELDEFGPEEDAERFTMVVDGRELEAWRSKKPQMGSVSGALGVFLPSAVEGRSVMLFMDRSPGEDTSAPEEEDMRSLLTWFDLSEAPLAEPEPGGSSDQGEGELPDTDSASDPQVPDGDGADEDSSTGGESADETGRDQ